MKKVFCMFVAIAAILLPVATSFGDESPWLVESASAGGLTPPKRQRQIFAKSFQWVPIREAIGGDVEVERWVNSPPSDLAGKYVLIEVWATWCPPCRRGLPLLNYFHEKYKDELVVVSICETDEKALDAMNDPIRVGDIKCHLAVDTHRRLRSQLGAYGIPHAILIEPTEGVIIWEGMPTFIGYELSDDKMQKFLSVGRKARDDGKLPTESPFAFVAKQPDPDKKFDLPPHPANKFGAGSSYGVPSTDADNK
ncbi:MAG: TlpA family protein disulfide reductase [Thermoguttaceae bacterium]